MSDIDEISFSDPVAKERERLLPGVEKLILEAQRIYLALDSMDGVDGVRSIAIALNAFASAAFTAAIESAATFVVKTYGLAEVGTAIRELAPAQGLPQELGASAAFKAGVETVREALRAPTGAMLDAGGTAWDRCYRANRDGSGDYSAEETAGEIFAAMVGALTPPSSQATPQEGKE